MSFHECAPSHIDILRSPGRCVDTAARIVRFCIRSDQGKLAERRGRKASGTGPIFKREMVYDSGVTSVIVESRRLGVSLSVAPHA